jgi:hypothetical protein
MITTIVTVKNHNVYCRSPAVHVRLVTVVSGLKMEYPIVYAHLRYDEIRSLPNESNTIKNGRLMPGLIDFSAP